MTNSFANPLPEAMVFDWDNTLVDNWETITEALNAARSAYDLETWTPEEARVKSDRALRDSFPEWFGHHWEAARDIFYNKVNEVHLQFLRVLPGAQELLAFLEEAAIPAFVVSNKKNTLLRAEITHLGWNRYFKGVAGSLDAPRDKPDRAPVDMVLNAAGLKADNPKIWFIGDTAADVECALRSGITPVLVHKLDIAERMGLRLSFFDCHSLKTTLYNWSNFKSTRDSINDRQQAERAGHLSKPS